MHDRLTWFCVACGLRQAEAERCDGCRASELSALRDPTNAASMFEIAAQRTIAQHEHRLIHRSKSVREGPVKFGLGSAGIFLPFGLPVLIGAPLYGAAGLGAIFLVGAALGGAISLVAPRWLLGKQDKLALARELSVLASTHKHMRVLARPDDASSTFETHVGTLEGVPAPSPFGEEPVLAARIQGRYGPLEVDDAWIAPGALRLVGRDGEGDTPPWELVLDRAANFWLGDLTERVRPELAPPLEAFFASRGVALAGAQRAEAMDSLHVHYLRAGDEVRVRGRAGVQHVPDGYRGTREVADLGGTVFIEAT